MRNFNYYALSSICALIIGILLVVWPGEAVRYLVITIGVLFMLPGLIGVFGYLATAKRRQEAGIKSVFPVAAVGSALLGFWLMIMPDFFITTLMYVLGVLLVLAGLSQLFNFISVRSISAVSDVCSSCIGIIGWYSGFGKSVPGCNTSFYHTWCFRYSLFSY